MSRYDRGYEPRRGRGRGRTWEPARISRVMPSGRFEARTRYRDWDGRARQVQSTGATAKAAERALKDKLAERFRSSRRTRT